MKKVYEKPMISVENFAANEFIASCGDSGTNYLFECNAPKGTLYYFPKSDGILDGIYNGHGKKKELGNYKPCEATHKTENKGDFYEGFVDYNENERYDPEGSWKNGKRTPAEAVIVWHDGSKRGWHATKNLDINSWETAKS